MKSMSGLDLVFKGVIITSTLLVATLAPVNFKMNLDMEAHHNYGYYKVQNTLLTLLSITHENKKVYEQIAERFTIGEPPNLGFLEQKLNKLTGSRCYELNVSTETLTERPKDCKLNHFASTFISLPYNPENLVQEIMVGLE